MHSSEISEPMQYWNISAEVPIFSEAAVFPAHPHKAVAQRLKIRFQRTLVIRTKYYSDIRFDIIIFRYVIKHIHKGV